MRFFSLGNDVSRTAHDEATVDNVHSLGLLATVGSPERVVGHALYARVETHDDWDSIDVTFPSSLTPDALVRFEQREELASANALRRVLYPRSVAVIGASERPGAVGAAVVRNLLAAGFPGPIYPINPAGGVIQAL